LKEKVFLNCTINIKVVLVDKTILNMNKKILGLGIATLALGAIVMIPGVSDAYRGDTTVKGPNYTVERHTAMEKALETNDYTTWQKLMEGRGNVTKIVTKDNFAKFAQIHKLTEEGKTAEAQKIRQELGLSTHNGAFRGNGQGHGMHRNR